MIDYSVSDGVCVLRLDAPPVNAIDFALLEALRSAVARANADPAVRGIVLTGSGKHFSAGADVRLFRQITTGADAVSMSRTFQEAMSAVEDSAKPVAAAVMGKMMGCAVELAAACHVRLCAAGATFRMPEVTLGINPGAGGTGRLPRLVGPEPAIRMLLTAEAIDADRAVELGLVDEVCPGGELLARAEAVVRAAPAPRRTRDRTEKVRDAGACARALAEGEKLLAGVREELVAPGKILQAVRAGLDESFAAGLRAEQNALAECLASRATRNRIYLFFATRDMGKVEGLAEPPAGAIARAGVVGMGSMGTGIVHALALAGVRVVVRDEDDAALQRGLRRIRRSIEKRVQAGRWSARRGEETLALIETTTRWSDLADADVVIEAVFEDLDVKRRVLSAIEDVCRDEALIATNTSTISLDALAEALRDGDRLVGMHFFNPAQTMPLVEVVRRPATSPRAVATALRFAKQIRKTPVLVRNREGFLVNRVFVPYFKEAFRLLEDGAAAGDIDAAMVAFGFPMGPLALIDLAGIDILLAVDRVMSRAFASHGRLSAVVVDLVEAGQCGQKSGAGVYRYERGEYAPHDSETTERIVRAVRQRGGITPRAIGTEEITQRLVLRMVNEAFHVLAEGIARRESDMDAAMVLGTGFPGFRGGVLRHARDLGLVEVLADLDRLAGALGPRYAPSELLRKLAAEAR